MPFLERFAGQAFAASGHIFRSVLAIDRTRQDACAGGLAHTPRTGEEEGVRQVTALDRVLERAGHSFLAHHGIEGGRAVFSGAYDELFHADEAKIAGPIGTLKRC